jgi:hypothetical protein
MQIFKPLIFSHVINISASKFICVMFKEVSNEHILCNFKINMRAELSLSTYYVLFYDK